MSAHVLKVVFVAGLQKLREIIGLKLGKKITLFQFPSSWIHSKLVFTESRTLCTK